MYSIGSKKWPGLAKIIEESGELLQVLGKIQALDGNTNYYNNIDLDEKLKEELADVLAAIEFFMIQNFDIDDRINIYHRADAKTEQFYIWQDEYSYRGDDDRKKNVHK